MLVLLGEEVAKFAPRFQIWRVDAVLVGVGDQILESTVPRVLRHWHWLVGVGIEDEQVVRPWIAAEPRTESGYLLLERFAEFRLNRCFGIPAYRSSARDCLLLDETRITGAFGYQPGMSLPRGFFLGQPTAP
jgi:hypothetical protein